MPAASSPVASESSPRYGTTPSPPTPSVLETYVSYVRQKVDATGPPLIQTVRGVGYSLRLPAGHRAPD